jgi:hypothetical protein
MRKTGVVGPGVNHGGYGKLLDSTETLNWPSIYYSAFRFGYPNITVNWVPDVLYEHTEINRNHIIKTTIVSFPKYLTGKPKITSVKNCG